MRYTLEQLKAMSEDLLQAHWLDWEFPFDAANCDRCVTGHHESFKGGCRFHNKLRVLVTDLGEPLAESSWWIHFKSIFHRGQDVNGAWLKKNLEELYALRLFYDSLYPPSEPSPAPAEEVKETHANTL